MFRNTPQDHRLCGFLRLHHFSEIKKPRVLMLKEQESKDTQKRKKHVFCGAKILLPLQIQNSILGKLIVQLIGRWLFSEGQNSTVKITVYIFEYLQWSWCYLRALLIWSSSNGVRWTLSHPHFTDEDSEVQRG